MSFDNQYTDDEDVSIEQVNYPNFSDKTSNAMRFINAYNIIDQSLRGIYNFKRNISFADVVRRTVPLNSVIRHYEDKLIDYGRLRNSIVHNSTEERVIAEPHVEVVKEMEHIAQLISSPPKAVNCIKKKDVQIIDYRATIADAIALLSSRGFKSIPVYQEGALVGVLDSVQIVNVLGGALKNEVLNISKFISTTPVCDILTNNNEGITYLVCSEEITVQEVLNYFYNNRKLQALIITKHGTENERAINILTNADFIDLNKIIDDYNI